MVRVARYLIVASVVCVGIELALKAVIGYLVNEYRRVDGPEMWNEP